MAKKLATLFLNMHSKHHKQVYTHTHTHTHTHTDCSLLQLKIPKTLRVETHTHTHTHTHTLRVEILQVKCMTLLRVAKGIGQWVCHNTGSSSCGGVCRGFRAIGCRPKL